MFGYNALFTKPAQSLAPMMIVEMLSRNNYQDKVAQDMSASEVSDLKSAMFMTACVIPIVIGVLQIAVWRPFSIRDSHVSSRNTLINSATVPYTTLLYAGETNVTSYNQMYFI